MRPLDASSPYASRPTYGITFHLSTNVASAMFLCLRTFVAQGREGGIQPKCTHKLQGEQKGKLANDAAPFPALRVRAATPLRRPRLPAPLLTPSTLRLAN